MTRTARVNMICIIALSACLPAVLAEDKAKSVDGAWKLVEQKNGDAQEYQKPADGTAMIDCIVGGRFIWTVSKDGKAYAAVGGRYKQEGDKFTEIVEYINGQGIPESFVGSSFEFTVKFEGETFTKVGTIQINGQDYKIDEKWERCKP